MHTTNLYKLIGIIFSLVCFYSCPTFLQSMTMSSTFSISRTVNSNIWNVMSQFLLPLGLYTLRRSKTQKYPKRSQQDGHSRTRKKRINTKAKEMASLPEPRSVDSEVLSIRPPSCESSDQIQCICKSQWNKISTCHDDERFSIEGRKNSVIANVNTNSKEI